MKIDMHIHTIYSDGLNTPKELVDMAIKENLDAIAITDHDSIDGVKEAIDFSKDKDIEIIPGIEISCENNDEEVHILGYFIDYEDKGLIDLTKQLKIHRYKRAIKIIEKLEKLGIDIDEKELYLESENKSVGRPTIASLLVKKGYVNTIEAAFEKFIGNDMPAYVEKYKLDVKFAIDLIHELKGIAVIAHPGDVSQENFLQLLKLDFDGVECIHPKHNLNAEKYFKKMALNKKMIITGGSDYHGENLKGRDGLGRYTIEVNEIDYFYKRSDLNQY